MDILPQQKKSQVLNKKLSLCLWGMILLILCSCAAEVQKTSLPIIGNRDFVDGDTIYHTIPSFNFVNQDNQAIDKSSFENKIYVADFFFTSCPSICPKMKAQMLRIYHEFENEDRMSIVSHTMDPVRDDVAKLKNYADKLGVSSKRWHFLTGDKDQLHDLADDYFNIVITDPEAPGGYDHSPYFVLVDKKGHVRSKCNGTDKDEVDEFMDDIRLLLNEG